MYGEFRAFLLKSNALALAIGVILGAALGSVVQSLVNDILMPCTPERVWRAINDSGGGGADPTTGAAAPHFDAAEGTEGAGS